MAYFREILLFLRLNAESNKEEKQCDVNDVELGFIFQVLLQLEMQNLNYLDMCIHVILLVQGAYNR